MKKIILLAAFVGLGIQSYAQRASRDKQEEILAKQDSIVVTLDQLSKSQQQLLELYGGQIDENNQKDVVSYAYGLSIAESFKQQGMTDINLSAFMKGMQDVLMEKEPMMNAQQAQQVINDYMTQIMQVKAQAAKKAGEEFLVKNAERKEVQTTASGLQYEVLKEGDGESPKASDNVTVHYEGTLLDGTVFDSSKERGQPATFGLSQVIPGWTEGLQLMKPGAKYKLYIPSDLAYGDKGAGQVIGPSETLIFEVELISVNDKK